MKQNAAFTGHPVSSLQEMLRALSYVHREIPALVPTGRFGPFTLEGVMAFQKEAHLPVTGRVDLATWRALEEEYRRVCREMSPPRAAVLYPCDGTEIQPGEETPLLYPVQGMFCALAGVLEDFSAVVPTGKCDEGTVANIRALQRCAGLEETGRFCRAEWEALSRLYEVVTGIRE